MERWKYFWGVMVICLIVVAAYSFPVSCSYTLEGIKYQLGKENQEYVEKMELRIDGKVSRTIWGTKSFEGTMSIDGELDIFLKYPNKLKFDKNNFAWHRPELRSDFNYPEYTASGEIYANQKFNEFSILLHQPYGENPSGWNNVDGWIFAAPAKNRAEAIVITKKFIPEDIRE